MARGFVDGARLMRSSFELVRRDLALLWFPVISACCLVLIAGFWIFEGAWLYAAICTATSVVGGLLGYAIGALLFDSVGHWLIQVYGLGDKVESWISTNPNKPVSPGEIEQGMGSDMVNWLTKETGLAKDQLLSGLAKYLPEAVDKYTPDGRVPAATEVS